MKQKSAERIAQTERRKQVRKEKSKEAARCRREKECEIFADLTDALPVAEITKSTMDKTSIIRLAISFMKLRNIYQNVWSDGMNKLCDVQTIKTEDDVSLDMLDDVSQDFVLMLTANAEIVYVTENIKKRLGINQCDMVGHNLEQFIHPSDWRGTEQTLRSTNNSISFTSRFKSTLLPKGRVVNIKSATYKTVRFSGQMMTTDIKPGLSPQLSDDLSRCLVLTGTPIDSGEDCHQDSMTFMSKHSLDMKFTQCDGNVADLLNYSPEKMAKNSFYEFVHASDLKSVEASFESLYQKEQIYTDVYRFLANGGGYVRVITQASLVNDAKTGRPQRVDCVHQVIGEIEEPGLIMGSVQSTVKTESVYDYTSSPGGSSGSNMDILKPMADMYVDCSGSNTSLCESSSSAPPVCDDIYAATACVFLSTDSESDQDISKSNENRIAIDTEGLFGPPEPTDHDIMATTASMFSDLSPAEKPPTVSSEKTELEQLVEELDNDYIDMKSGILSDMFPQLVDDANDMFWRAPYIPMEGIDDQALYGTNLELSSECQPFTEEPKQSDMVGYRSPQMADSQSNSLATSPQPSIDISQRGYDGTTSPTRNRQSTAPYNHYQENIASQYSENVGQQYRGNVSPQYQDNSTWRPDQGHVVGMSAPMGSELRGYNEEQSIPPYKTYRYYKDGHISPVSSPQQSPQQQLSPSISERLRGRVHSELWNPPGVTSNVTATTTRTQTGQQVRSPYIALNPNNGNNTNHIRKRKSQMYSGGDSRVGDNSTASIITDGLDQLAALFSPHSLDMICGRGGGVGGGGGVTLSDQQQRQFAVRSNRSEETDNYTDVGDDNAPPDKKKNKVDQGLDQITVNRPTAIYKNPAVMSHLMRFGTNYPTHNSLSAGAQPSGVSRFQINNNDTSVHRMTDHAAEGRNKKSADMTALRFLLALND